MVEDGASCSDSLTHRSNTPSKDGERVNDVVEGDTASLVDGSSRQVGIIDRIPASSAGHGRILLPRNTSDLTLLLPTSNSGFDCMHYIAVLY